MAVRWLMWFTMGFCAACGVGAYLFRGMGLLILAAGCLVLVVPAVFFRKKWKYMMAAATILFGAAAGSGMFYGYDTLYLYPARQTDGEIRQISLTASDYCWQTEYGCAVDGTIQLDGRSYKIRLYLDDNFEIAPGDMVETPAELRFTDEGGQSEPTFHRTNGILLLGYQQDQARLVRGVSGWFDFPGLLRQRIKSLIEGCFPADTMGFAKALLLGDKAGLDYETTLSFRLTGLSHIVAVSGLHLSILFALIYRIAGKRRFLTALIGIPAVILFAAVAGFTPSVTRAAIMQIIMMLALLMRREYDPPTALACAVLVMLVWNPLVIASAGFQMSVCSVAGIYLFYSRIEKWLRAKLKGEGKGLLRRLAKGFVSSVALSVSATLLTAPLVAFYYGTVSLVSLAANLVVVPIISVIFYGIILACLAGVLLPAWSVGIGWLVSWLIRYVFGVTGFLSGLPLAAVYTESPYIVFWLVLVYGVVADTIALKRSRIWPAVCCVVLGLCLALTASWAEPLLDDYRVTVLDVGQGQCVLLQSCGCTFMVDCGGDYDEDAGDKAAEALLSMGISRIDGLILTHYDEDHVGGAAMLSRRIKIDRVYLPKIDAPSDLLSRVLASTRGAEWIWMDMDLEIAFGNCEIRIFPPETEKSGNESCAAVLFRSEKYDTLITGDMNAAREWDLLERAELPDLELLIAGHHGSATSTSAELVYRTAPDVVIISVGKNNSYGHPAEEILFRLKLYECEIYRTDLMGDILFRG